MCPLGCCPVDNNSIARLQKIHIFCGRGRRKNHGVWALFFIWLWVVFLETYCKIKAKIQPILLQNLPKIPPQIPNYFFPTQLHSKSPRFSHFSTTISIAPNPNRQTTSLTLYCSRLHIIHGPNSISHGHLTISYSHFLSKTLSTSHLPQTLPFNNYI